VQQQPQELLNIAVAGGAAIERRLELTIGYVNERDAFVRPAQSIA